MQIKKLFWPLISIIIIILIYTSTGSVNLLHLNLFWFLLSIVAFFISTIFWAISWAEIFAIPYFDAILLNTKSLLGIFTPANLGGDALRSYFASKNNYSAPKALASSLVVKFFKFILMGFFLIFALCFISGQLEFPEFSIVFLFIIIFTFSAAIFILILTNEKIIKLFRSSFAEDFRKQLVEYFLRIDAGQIARVVALLVISTVFEIMSIALCFEALGIGFSLLGIFIVSTILNSFVVAAITPQGIGIVEAGGYFILSFSMFAMTKAEIGSFLILWNIIRVWVPIFIGFALTMLKK